MSKKNKFLSFLEGVATFLDKEKIVEFLVNICFFVMIFIFIYINVVIYTKHTSTFLEALVNGLIVGSLEVTATWVLFRSRKIFVSKEKKFILKTILLLIVWFGLSIPSIFSRVSYIVESVQKQSNLASSQTTGTSQSSIESKNIDDDIQVFKDNITDLKEKKRNATEFTNANWSIYQVKDYYQKQINSNQNLIDKKIVQKGIISSNINLVTTNKIVSIDDTYTIMGKPFGFAGIAMFTLLLIIRLFFLDICIILIVFLSKKKKELNLETQAQISVYIRDNHPKLLQYVEALFTGIDETHVRLKNDTDISKLTKIPIDKCQEFRRHLRTDIQFNKKPAIKCKKGGYQSDWDKNQVIKLINSYSYLN